MPLKFGVDIQSQTKVRVWKPKKNNMVTRRPFWKWPRWKSIGFCLWPPSTCIWSLKLKFQSKLDLHPGNLVTYRVQKPKNLESENQKIQYGHQAAILKVTSLKINRLLPMTTINMHMKFEIEIPKQTWLTSRKPCHLQSPETEKSRVWKPKNPIWPPGGHFESDIAENQ